MLNKVALKKLLNDPSLENQRTEELNSYVTATTRNRRAHIPKMSQTQIEMEEVVSQLIQSFIAAPCSIQIDYNQDAFSLSSVKTFVSILLEQDALWKVILKNQSWVSVGFNADKTDISFSNSAIELGQLEELIKTIKTKTTDISAYHIAQRDSHFEINFKIDGLAHTKLNTEGSII